MYKIATSENWSIMVPVTGEEAARYQEEIGENSDSFVLHVKFRKDDTETNATTYIKDLDGQKFLQLNLNNSMVRFVSDRYIEVELGSDKNTGLKIPNSAIIEKEFLVVPKKYVGKGDNSSSDGVIKITKDKRGKESAEFVSINAYAETDDSYYVSQDNLSVGDTIQMPDSSEQYSLKDTAKRKGVYNMDKGYAIFRQIEVISDNEEYSVVQSGTKFGISLYDHIALNGSEVQEGDFLN